MHVPLAAEGGRVAVAMHVPLARVGAAARPLLATNEHIPQLEVRNGRDAARAGGSGRGAHAASDEIHYLSRQIRGSCDLSVCDGGGARLWSAIVFERVEMPYSMQHHLRRWCGERPMTRDELDSTREMVNLLFRRIHVRGNHFWHRTIRFTCRSHRESG